ncbi:MAG: FliM/FliN family flagellar motor switch protein [Armatimonadota bacterium]
MMSSNRRTSPRVSNPQQTSRLDKEQARFVQALHAEYAHHIQRVSSQLFGTPSISVLSLEETTAVAFQRSNTTPGFRLHFADRASLVGMLELDPRATALAIDHMLGYEGAQSSVYQGLSEIEEHLLRDSLVPLLAAYTDLWSQHAPVALHTESIVGAWHAEEPLYVARYCVQTAGGTGEVMLILNLQTWQKVLGKIKRQQRIPDNAESADNAILGTIGDCQLSLRAILGRTNITVGELLGLQAGDVICLDHAADDPIEVWVGKHPKLRGQVQVQQGRYLITVAGVAEPKEKA